MIKNISFVFQKIWQKHRGLLCYLILCVLSSLGISVRRCLVSGVCGFQNFHRKGRCSAAGGGRACCSLCLWTAADGVFREGNAAAVFVPGFSV